MANPRALDRRRKSIRNIKKITRTMELIATARFKKAMDRASAATAYTDRITQVVSDLANAGLEVSHPLLEEHAEKKSGTLLVLTANRGLCGGYNGNVIRKSSARRKEMIEELPEFSMDVSGKRGISGFRFAISKCNKPFCNLTISQPLQTSKQIANVYLQKYINGELDRLEVAYTQFHSVAKQKAVIETLLPMGTLDGVPKPRKTMKRKPNQFTNLSPVPRASLKRSCRPVSRSNCSSASLTLRSVNRSAEWWQ